MRHQARLFRLPASFSGSHELNSKTSVTRATHSLASHLFAGAYARQLNCKSQMADGFYPVPERKPDLYGPRARQNRTKCSQLAADFSKDGVKRARERNLRYGTSCMNSDRTFAQSYTDKLSWTSVSKNLDMPTARSCYGPEQGGRKPDSYGFCGPGTQSVTTRPSNSSGRAHSGRSNLYARRRMAGSMP